MLWAILIFATGWAILVHAFCFAIPSRLRKRQLRKRQAGDMYEGGQL